MSAQDTAHRVGIWHAVASEADDLLRSVDGLACLDEHERAVRFAACVGDICTDIARNGCADADELLLRLAAEVQLALEARAREAAR